MEGKADVGGREEQIEKRLAQQHNEQVEGDGAMDGGGNADEKENGMFVYAGCSSQEAEAECDEDHAEEDDEDDGDDDDNDADGSSGKDDDTQHTQIPPEALQEDSNATVTSWPTPLDNDENATIEITGENESSNMIGWPILHGVPNEAVLEWLQQHQQLLVRVATWNLQGKSPPKKSEIQAKLLPPNKFHVYIVGSEECERNIASSAVNPSKKVWEGKLNNLLGENYTAICSHTLQAMHSMAFVHNALLPIVSNAHTTSIATGIANTFGNKGAVALSFNIASTSFLFINAHLAAHQKHVKTRNEQYHRIMDGIFRHCVQGDMAHMNRDNKVDTEAERSMRDSRTATPSGSTTLENTAKPAAAKTAQTLFDVFDHVMFAGDLNYRIRGNRQIVDKLIHNGMHEVLLANDQLLWSMQKQLSFQGFIEGPLNFRPTYKLQRGTDRYDPGPKKRIPAWTDRILYSPNACQLLTYQSEPTLRSSDHRPVYASFAIDLQISCDSSEAKHKPSGSTGPGSFVTASEVCAIM